MLDDKSSEQSIDRLIDAIKTWRPEKVKAALKKCSDINLKNKAGVTPLQAALKTGQIAIIEMVLAKKPDINRTDTELTALSQAAISGNMKSVNLMLAAGANLNGTDAQGNTALHHAAAAGQCGVCKQLIAKSIALHRKNLQGQTAIDIATKPAIKTLIEAAIARECKEVKSSFSALITGLRLHDKHEKPSPLKTLATDSTYDKQLLHIVKDFLTPPDKKADSKTILAPHARFYSPIPLKQKAFKKSLEDSSTDYKLPEKN